MSEILSSLWNFKTTK